MSKDKDNGEEEEETPVQKAGRKYREAVAKDKEAQQKDPKKRWGKS